MRAIAKPLLVDVSSDWKIESLRKYLTQNALDDNDYRQILGQASALGKFKTCHDLKIYTLATNDKSSGPAEFKLITGPCDFEHGSGKVSFIFKRKSDKFEVAAFSAVPDQ